MKTEIICFRYKIFSSLKLCTNAAALGVQYISNDGAHDDGDGHGGGAHDDDDARDDDGDHGDGRDAHGDDGVLPPLQVHLEHIGERRSSTWREGLQQRTSCLLLYVKISCRRMRRVIIDISRMYFQ
ncbi:hypothetical protein NPIL_258771 [Nephila pilipes]|uniref:Uncharacterized protein n=1 Tax=Nephila pilipes TaxID=299642 RepID=A0A8X6Q3B7_NEPPI|nr:hypothetical protein NPIL_258771 [Nephila pilipes]